MSDVSGAAELRVICGPTASGKSALALQLAREFGGAIISADSRQIYTGFDIGTAKPTRAEQSAIRHYCIDIVAPTERYSAAAWAVAAQTAIRDCIASSTVPVVVGGTGFYLKALIDPLFREPALDHAARHALQQQLDLMETAELRRWCMELDPARSHLGRTQLLRAIEIVLLTGRRLSALHATSAREPAFKARYLVVDPGVELQSRIAERTQWMLDNGWLDEVRELMRTVPESAPAWNATGYAVVRRLVRGEITHLDAASEIVIKTRQYAKRQRTWFRNQLPSGAVITLEGDADAQYKLAANWWRGGNSN